MMSTNTAVRVRTTTSSLHLHTTHLISHLSLNSKLLYSEKSRCWFVELIQRASPPQKTFNYGTCTVVIFQRNPVRRKYLDGLSENTVLTECWRILTFPKIWCGYRQSPLRDNRSGGSLFLCLTFLDTRYRTIRVLPVVVSVIAYDGKRKRRSPSRRNA